MIQAPLTTYEMWSLITQGTSALVAVIGLPIVWYQLRRHRTDRADESRQQRAELEADHDRRKKQATIEYCNQLRREWREQRTAIRTVLGKGSIDDAKLAQIKGNLDLEEKVLSLLSSMETFAGGANAEVFDADLISNVCGSYLIAVHDDLERFIKDRRRGDGPSVYTEFETLVAKMRSKRLPAPVEAVKRPTPHT